LLLLFIFRPYENSPLYLSTWKFLLTGTVLAAIFNCKHSYQIKVIEVALAIPTALLFWADLWWQHHWVMVLNTILSILFTFICAGSIVQDVLLKAKVTFETLRGVICAYLLVAFGFAYLFWLIEYLEPKTFSIRGDFHSIFSYSEYISEMLYFSFTTLLTIGYGDIVPNQNYGQTAAVVEGAIGQFYLAILVARLVSAYTIYSHIELLAEKKLEKLEKQKQKN
jgi:hypothetical protein